MHIDATELLPSSTDGSNADQLQDDTKQKKDATETSELLALEIKCLDESA